MKVNKKVNFGLKEIINAGSATEVVKNFSGKKLIVTGLLIAVKEDVDGDTGELTTTEIGVLKTKDGKLISSISPTVLNSIDTIINTYTDAGMLEDIEKGIEVMIKADKSAKGREFFHLELL